MFAKNKVTQSMVDAVNQVLKEDEKKRLINDAEIDETGFHKAAHAAKRANQSHFEFQGKKYPVTAKSHKEAIEMDEASLKIPTGTGTKVLGRGYGNSAKAHEVQHKNPFEKGPSKSDLKGIKAPTKKELKSIGEEDLSETGDCVTEPQAKKIAKKEVGHHNVTMHKGKKSTVKEGSFAYKLLTHIAENKSAHPEEIFTDNNLGEEEMSDKQMKKREKIILSMKKGEPGFKQRYGKNWKNVMYATATKQAMKEDSSDTWNGSYDFVISEKTEESVNEMDSEGHTGSREDPYDYKKGKWKEAKPMKGKDMQDFALDSLTKKMKEPKVLAMLKRLAKEEIEEEELGEGNAALNAFDKATKRSAAARKAGQELLGQVPKKQGLPFDPDPKSVFKKSNNPNRSGIDTARALAQKGMTKEEIEELDELNYDTVKSLYKKRRDDYHGAEVGKKKKGKEVSAKNVGASISRLTGFKTTQNKPQKPTNEDVELDEHKVGDMVTVDSKFFGKQKGKVTKVDSQSVHVQRDGKKFSEKYPHNAVMKESAEWDLEEGDAQYKKNPGTKPMTDLVDRKKTVKDLMKGRKYFGTGKVKEEVDLDETVDFVQDKNSHKITTDMLRGRVPGGKLNSFKNFKVNLVTSGEEDIPKDVDKGGDTKEKQKVTTNPGPVDIKLDDKLTGPTPYTHFSDEKHITSESVELTESSLEKFLSQKGIEMKNLSYASRIAYSKSNEFLKWRQNHQMEEVEMKHNPSNRAKELALNAMKKLKKETMMGKISN